VGSVVGVSRDVDYAVSWSFPGVAEGMAILRHDGSRVEVPDVRASQVVPIGEGYLVTHNYSDTFFRLSVTGDRIGAPLTLPERMPPHWQSVERHGDLVRFVAHSLTDPTPHAYAIDVDAWTFSRAAVASPPGSAYWAFTSDRALILRRTDAGSRLLGLRDPASGIDEVLFEIEAPFEPTDIRFDEASESWRLAGRRQTASGAYVVASARVSMEGTLTELAELPPDAPDTGATVWAENGPDATVAGSPLGPALAVTPIYFGRDHLAPVTVLYPTASGDALRGGGTYGVPTAFRPSITWSDADSGFAIVSAERDEDGRTYLALRCGLRP
ncbi:MAG: hypothetical protein KC619_26145, partial [Myxococcales bacterium]|nr:hypothetical protein [Myxococcales bacterium]